MNNRDLNKPKIVWLIDIFVDVARGKEGQMRTAVVQMKQGLFIRPVVKLVQFVGQIQVRLLFNYQLINIYVICCLYILGNLKICPLTQYITHYFYLIYRTLSNLLTFKILSKQAPWNYECTCMTLLRVLICKEAKAALAGK